MNIDTIEKMQSEVIKELAEGPTKMELITSDGSDIEKNQHLSGAVLGIRVCKLVSGNGAALNEQTLPMCAMYLATALKVLDEKNFDDFAQVVKAAIKLHSTKTNTGYLGNKKKITALIFMDESFTQGQKLSFVNSISDPGTYAPVSGVAPLNSAVGRLNLLHELIIPQIDKEMDMEPKRQAKLGK